MKRSAPNSKAPKPGSRPARPVTKEEALQREIQKDPEKAAQMLRDILKGRA